MNVNAATIQNENKEITLGKMPAHASDDGIEKKTTPQKNHRNTCKIYTYRLLHIQREQNSK